MKHLVVVEHGGHAVDPIGPTHVLLAVKSGLVARLAEERGEACVQLFLTHGMAGVGVVAIGGGGQAGEEDGAARHADGGLREGVFETHAARGEPVDDGRFDLRMAGATEGSVALIVDEDEDDVGFPVGGEQSRDLAAEAEGEQGGQ